MAILIVDRLSIESYFSPRETTTEECAALLNIYLIKTDWLTELYISAFSKEASIEEI